MSKDDAPPKNIKDYPMYPSDTRLSLTISPAYQCTKAREIVHRPECEIKYMITHFMKWMKPYANVLLVPEIGKNSGHWHWHGVITIHDTFGFHCYALPRIHGCSIFKIDIINDEEEWKDYIFKNTSIMEPALKRLELPYIVENSTKLQN